MWCKRVRRVEQRSKGIGGSSGASTLALSPLEMVRASPESGVAFRSGGDGFLFYGHDEGLDTGGSPRGIGVAARGAVPDCLLDGSGSGCGEAWYQSLLVVGRELDGDDRRPGAEGARAQVRRERRDRWEYWLVK